MRVNFAYLLDALHMEDVESDEPSPRMTASRVLDYLYTETGYRAFVAIVRELVEQKPQAASGNGGGDVPAGVDEDQFATLMRRMTDYRDWQIVDLFTLFDREGDSMIRTSDLFIFVALLVSTEARRSLFVFYLHRQDIFELFSRSALPRGIDDDDDDDDEDVGDEDEDKDNSDEDEDEDDDDGGGRVRRGRLQRSVSEGGERPAVRVARPVALDTSVRVRDEDGARASPVSPETPVHTPPLSPTLLACPTINFAQFCGVGVMLGMAPPLLVSVLRSFGLREDSDFAYQDFLVYAYWILAHMDAKDDTPLDPTVPRP